MTRDSKLTVIPAQRDGGKFAKGHRKVGGRKKGSKNRTQSDIRQALVDGPARVGSDGLGAGDLAGFCEQAARELAERQDRAAYLATLSKLLPTPKADRAGGVGSSIDADGNNTCFHVEVVPIMSGYMQLPNGHYAPYEEAHEIWQAHKAQLATKTPIPIRPLARVEDPDDLLPAV